MLQCYLDYRRQALDPVAVLVTVSGNGDQLSVRLLWLVGMALWDTINHGMLAAGGQVLAHQQLDSESRQRISQPQQ